MNKYNKYILQTIEALLLSVLVASCSLDDVEQSLPLPPGQYPLDLTVSVEGMKSRALGKDSWTEGDEIGVRIGSDANLGRYTLNSDGSVNIDKSANLLHWKNTSSATVKAWYPSEPKTDVSIADQAKLSDLSSIDFLAATAENQSYKKAVGLTFKHQMAKVKCMLKSADTDEISSKELANATVTFNGCTVASFVEGELTGNYFGDISPIKSGNTYEALLVPADMRGKELFRINLKVRGYDKSFSYIPDDDYADLKPGTSYVFNVTLRRDKLVVNAISASWDGESEEISAESIPLNLYLPKEFFDLLDSGQLEISEHAKPSTELDREDITPEDDKYLVDGNTFTISLTLDDDGENFIKGFNVIEGVASVNRVRLEDKHVFTFKANTESVRLEYGDYMQVGDYLYTNGKWRPDIVGLDLSGNDDDDGEGESGNKNPSYGYGYDDGEEWKCIGVIFKVGPGNGDTVENYDGRLETIHGYAVALHDAAAPDSIGNWGGCLDDGVRDAEAAIGLYYNFTDLYNGYTNTQKMLPIANDKKDKYDRFGEELAYWAFYKLNDYNETVEVPEYFSPWYLPSIGQLSDLYKFTGRRERLLKAGGEDFILSDVGIFPFGGPRFDLAGSKYWSSTQQTRDTVWVFRFQTGKPDKVTKLGVTPGSRYSLSRVRAVLTF